MLANQAIQVGPSFLDLTISDIFSLLDTGDVISGADGMD